MRARIYDLNLDNGTPRKRPVIVGERLDLAADGTLTLMDASGAHVVGSYCRARVLSISAHGLRIECFEERAAGRFVRRELWANTEEANGK